MQQAIVAAAATLLLLTVAAAFENLDEGVSIPGDVILGGLFPITDVGDCSSITSDRGIQRMEAMIFSLKEANSNQQLLRYGRHKIAIGGRLFDTCSNPNRALRKALRFLSGQVSNSDNTQDTADYACMSDNDTLVPAVRIGTPVNSSSGFSIRGVVGAAYSQVTYSVAKLLELFEIPMISYASTSSSLSNKPMFARIVSADSLQGRILADIVSQFNKWNFVSIVYSPGDYGEGLTLSFEQEAAKKGVCIGRREKIPFNPTPQELATIVNRLASQDRAKVVVLLLRWFHIKPFFDAVKQLKVRPGQFVWLASSMWGELNFQEARGAVIVEMDVPKLPNFASYFASLRPMQPRVLTGSQNKPGAVFFNRYFDQFWQKKFKCSLNDADENREVFEERRQPLCSSSLRIDQNIMEKYSKHQFVSDAVYTFVHALDKVMRLVCSPQDPDSDTKVNGAFDDCVKNITKISGRDLYELLVSKNNSFENQAGRKVEFDARGDGLPIFTILNYRYNTSNENYELAPVGTWHSSTGLDLRAEEIVWPDGRNEPPKSKCSDECLPGQRKRFSSPRGEQCCWSCSDSTLFHMRSTD